MGLTAEQLRPGVKTKVQRMLADMQEKVAHDGPQDDVLYRWAEINLTLCNQFAWYQPKSVHKKRRK